MKDRIFGMMCGRFRFAFSHFRLGMLNYFSFGQIGRNLGLVTALHICDPLSKTAPEGFPEAFPAHLQDPFALDLEA